VLLAGARRFLTLLAGIAGATVVLSLVLGLALGTSANRAISIGLDVVGAFLLVAGFFVGNRGPARLKDDGTDAEPLETRRRIRWATREERVIALNDSAIFVSVGFALILLGLAIDSRVRLI
jgi:hypothetical protein